MFRQVPPEPDHRGHVLGPDRAVGQSQQQAHARTAHATVCSRAHTPRLLRERRWHAERTQPDQRVDGRQDVFVEPGHVVSAPGQHGAAA